MPENPVHLRDGYKCARCGHRAESVQHRIHGNRRDNRMSNLVSLCGSGTTRCHGWVEAHWEDASRSGWTVSKFAPGGHVDTSAIKVYYEAGPLGRGWYLLGDDGTLNRTPAPDDDYVRWLG